MDKLKQEALFSEAPIPGQAWTNPRRTLPYDRPSEESSVEAYLEKVFRRMTDPKIASQFLAMIDSGIPIDHIVQTVVQSMFGEGKINANMLFLMIPPLTVMFWRMAEAAGMSPVVSSDNKTMDMPEMLLKTSGKTGKAKDKAQKAVEALKKSRQDIIGMPKKEGLMKRPEGMI